VDHPGSAVSARPTDISVSPGRHPDVAALTSIVIVNFNGGPLLGRCVEAALSSSAPVEVLVVDNASADGSLHTLKQRVRDERRVRILENAQNVGFARANNRALREVSGDYVLLLNPDCVVEADTVGRMRAVMDDHPEAAMAGCLLLNPDGTEQAGARRSVPTPWRAFVRAFGLARWFPNHPRLFSDYVLVREPLPSGPTPVEAISGAFMLVRPADMERVGLLDEGYFLHCEDLDWCMRFRQEGRQVLFVPDVAVVHYKGYCGRGRPFRVLWHMHRGMIRFYRKFFRHQYPMPLMWLVVAGVWLRFFALAVRAAVRRDPPAG
jgi:GT2 family glycosyltransferase